MASSKMKALISNMATEEIVTIIAGDTGTSYRVQRTLLCAISPPWFPKALSEQFAKGQHLELRFPDASTETVELFLYWLFTGNILVEQGHLHATIHLEFEKVVHLAVFAYKHFITKLQNIVLGHLHELCYRSEPFYPKIEVLFEAFEGSPPNSAIRRMLMRVLLMGLKAKKKYGTDEYQPEQLELLGAVSGFTSEFAQRSVNALCNNGSVQSGDLKEYLVREE